MRYVATAVFEERIANFGEGDTAEEALDDFMVEALCSHLDDIEAEEGDTFEIGVYTTIENGSPEWDEDMFDDEYEWVLKDRVITKEYTV